VQAYFFVFHPQWSQILHIWPFCKHISSCSIHNEARVFMPAFLQAYFFMFHPQWSQILHVWALYKHDSSWLIFRHA
jgi:hypothetical protein